MPLLHMQNLNNVLSHLWNKAINDTTASQLFQEAISSLWYPRQHATNGEAGKFTVYSLHSSCPSFFNVTPTALWTPNCFVLHYL